MKPAEAGQFNRGRGCPGQLELVAAIATLGKLSDRFIGCLQLTTALGARDQEHCRDLGQKAKRSSHSLVQARRRSKKLTRPDNGAGEDAPDLHFHDSVREPLRESERGLRRMRPGHQISRCSRDSSGPATDADQPQDNCEGKQDECGRERPGDPSECQNPQREAKDPDISVIRALAKQ